MLFVHHRPCLLTSHFSTANTWNRCSEWETGMSFSTSVKYIELHYTLDIRSLRAFCKEWCNVVFFWENYVGTERLAGVLESRLSLCTAPSSLTFITFSNLIYSKGDGWIQRSALRMFYHERLLQRVLFLQFAAFCQPGRHCITFCFRVDLIIYLTLQHSYQQLEIAKIGQCPLLTEKHALMGTKSMYKRCVYVYICTYLYIILHIMNLWEWMPKHLDGEQRWLLPFLYRWLFVPWVAMDSHLLV